MGTSPLGVITTFCLYGGGGAQKFMLLCSYMYMGQLLPVVAISQRYGHSKNASIANHVNTITAMSF